MLKINVHFTKSVACKYIQEFNYKKRRQTKTNIAKKKMEIVGNSKKLNIVYKYLTELGNILHDNCVYILN